MSDVDRPALTAAAEAEFEAKRQAAIKEKVDARYFSTALKEWSTDPRQSNTIPNAAMMAGVLVELCHRMDAVETRASNSSAAIREMTRLHFKAAKALDGTDHTPGRTLTIDNIGRILNDVLASSETPSPKSLSGPATQG